MVRSGDMLKAGATWFAEALDVYVQTEASKVYEWPEKVEERSFHLLWENLADIMLNGASLGHEE